MRVFVLQTLVIAPQQYDTLRIFPDRLFAIRQFILEGSFVVLFSQFLCFKLFARTCVSTKIGFTRCKPAPAASVSACRCGCVAKRGGFVAAVLFAH